MAAIDRGETGAIKDRGHSCASLQVLRRFCLTASFFAAWAMARPQPEPLLHFWRDGDGGIRRVRGLGSLRESTRCGSTIEPWDEAFAHLAIALSIDLGRYRP
jgi:hypothetical protein